MFSFFRIAFRNVLLAKRRTLLLGISLFFVSVIFILLSSLTKGITDRMIQSSTTLSAGHVNVGGFFKASARGSIPLISERGRVKEVVHRLLPDAQIIDRQRGWGRLIGPLSSINAGLSGINVEDEQRFFKSLTLAKESEYKDKGRDEAFGRFEDLAKRHSILLFAGQAKKLGLGVGDNLTIVTEGTGGQTNSLDLTVVAIAQDIGMSSNWVVFLPRPTVLELYSAKEDTTGFIMVYLKDIAMAETSLAILRKGLSDEGFQLMDYDPNPFFFKFEKVMGEDWLGQKLDLTLWKDEISYMLWITTALNLITFVIIAILSFIIASGIANTMWLAVRERIKEIGTMRAMGAQKEQILMIFILEALILGVLFVGGGALFSALLVVVLNSLAIPIASSGAKIFLMTQTLNFSLSFGQFLTTVIVFCSVAVLGAFFPALRAARLKPVEALQQGK